MKPNPMLSIVIPGYNHSDLSRAVLSDIARTGDVPDAEVIFVDDGSQDDTPAVVRAFPTVKYIRHEQNRGVAPAWNTGIKAATGDFIAIINNDVHIADPAWMSKTVQALAGKKNIVGVELVDFNRASFHNGRNVPYLNGWYFAFPRRIFSEIGLFEEAFAPASYEDVDICSRASFAGYKMETLPLRMQHAYSATVKGLAGDMPRLNARNRGIWLEKMSQLDRPRLKIVFDCPSNMRGGWKPEDLENRGLGGAETAITLLTRELASRGHDVLLFNDVAISDAGEHGVSHHPRSLIPAMGLDCDVFVTFRCPSEYISQSSAKLKVFWSCDQQTSGNWNKDIFPLVDAVVCISDYHANYMAERYNLVRNGIDVIGCPVQAWDYEPHLDKDPNQFIFCSVPHRGLQYMPMVMREIRKELPTAKLVITSDYRLWGAPDPRNDEFRPLLKGEDFRGKVDRKDLIALQSASVAYPYPCTYEECFGIAIAECAAAGAVPVTTDIGAVRQTVGVGGFVVGPPAGDFAKQIAAKTLEIHGNTEVMRIAIEQSWRWSVVSVGNKWEDLMYSVICPDENPAVEHPPFELEKKTRFPVGDTVTSVPST